MKKSVIFYACFIIAGTVSFAQETKEKEPPPPPPPPAKVDIVRYAPPVIVKSEDLEEFYNRNDSVAQVAWESKDVIIITRKDSSVEKYNLKKDLEKKAFRKKYGDSPPPPPPPPPAKRKKNIS